MPHTAQPLLAPAMLIVGTDKTDTILEHLPESFLLIDDGPIIDALILPKRRKVTRLDFSIHSLNPLKGMDYQKARQFIQILDAVFPEGESTLTKKNANFILLKALFKTKQGQYLDTLIPPPDPKNTGAVDAYQKIETLLLSPVIKRFLCNPTSIRFTGRPAPHGIVLARLDRATLGDFDCFVIGNLLAERYPGQVVIADFGFYATQGHIRLMRQGRLTAGVNFLDEVPERIRNQLLLMEPRIAAHTTYDDAETLAQFARVPKGTNAHAAFIDNSLRNKT